MAGGGLKAFGVELPILASVQRQGMLAVVGIMLLVLGLRLPASSRSGDGAVGPVVPPVSVAAPEKSAAAPVVAPQAAVSMRPEVPNIVGLPFTAARQFLLQNGWAPINSPSSPMANDDLGFRKKEIFDAGLFEAVSCSGAGMAPCMFRYRNPGGYVLQVVAVGEDIGRADVNDAKVFDCAATPKPEAC
jgi:hypothetical protein